MLRQQYIETIIPPFAALLRRWRPLLSGIHELTDSEGQSPLAVEDRPLATDVNPLEVAYLIFLLISHQTLFELPVGSDRADKSKHFAVFACLPQYM